MNTILAGRYQVVKHLGGGGFGQTFLAKDTHLPGHPHCVVKQLKPKIEDAATLEVAKRLFDREAETLYKLGDRDRIPRLLAHFEQNQEFYLVQEYIPGISLDEEITPSKQLSEAHVRTLLTDILEVLAFVHQENVIHRDLKPANLIRREKDGKIVLIDFGAVKYSTQASSLQGETSLTIAVGSPGYMPSEQQAFKPRFSSDVYAVGILALQALSGLSARDLPQDDNGEFVCHLLPNRTPIDPNFAAVIEKMVRYDYRQRYQNAGEALAALKQLPPLEQQVGYNTPTICTPAAPKSPTTPQNSDLPTQPLVPAKAVVNSDLPTQKLAQPESNPEVNSYTPTEVISQPKTAPQTEKTPSKNCPKSFPKPLAIAGMVVAVGLSLFLGTTYLFSEDPEASVEIARETNLSADELLLKADELRKAEKYLKAIATYQQAIALDSQIPEAYWGLCYSLNQTLASRRALEACNRALELNPNYPEAFWSKGTALADLQKPAEAIDAYDRAIALDPNFAQVWNNRGTALMELKLYQEALTAFEKAAEIDPNFVDAWANRGGALWALQRYDDAIASMDKALEINPNHPNANDLRQQAKRELGR
ncbi:MAG: serine/threonine-protein kinase [Oscillatoria sp. PMC 1051.18]|nr:serine/threonine-protein kinase [Oscillatoria sp. PMC 1050.18]MEC5029068.1 serine/threonine-protein kinase [Oscillatoria sp. PMC 1051.18]